MSFFFFKEEKRSLQTWLQESKMLNTSSFRGLELSQSGKWKLQLNLDQVYWWGLRVRSHNGRDMLSKVIKFQNFHILSPSLCQVFSTLQALLKTAQLPYGAEIGPVSQTSQSRFRTANLLVHTCREPACALWSWLDFSLNPSSGCPADVHRHHRFSFFSLFACDIVKLRTCAVSGVCL